MAKKSYNTTLDADLLKELKVLAAMLEIRQNALIEEAILYLLKKIQVAERQIIRDQVTLILSEHSSQNQNT